MKKNKYFNHQPSIINHQSGFTMIELLVVVTIIIVLTTIGLTSFQQASKNARNGKRKADLEAVRSALVLYRTDQGSYPVTTNWSTMMTAIADYTSNDVVVDPKNVGGYVYTYNGSSSSFNLCTVLEPNPGTAYCVTNP